MKSYSLHKTGQFFSALAWIGCCILLIPGGCSRDEPQQEVKSAPKPVDFTAMSWPIFRGDKRLSGRADCTVNAPLAPKWQFNTAAPVKSSPVLAQGKVFIANTDGKVFALAADTGLPVWNFATSGETEASPLVLDDLLYLGNSEGDFYALELTTGQPRWTHQAKGKILGSANWFDQQGETFVVYGSYDFFIYCLNARTGAEHWKFESENYINGTPAVTENHVIFGGCDAMVRFVNLQTGQQDFFFDAETYVAGSAACEGQEIFFGNFEETLFCYDSAARQEKWRFASPRRQGFYASPAVSGDWVVAASKDRNLYGLDRATGQRRWTLPTQSEIDCSPVIAESTVVAATGDGRVHLLELTTGKPLWSWEIGAEIAASPAVTSGWVFIAATDGILYAFGPQ